MGRKPKAPDSVNTNEWITTYSDTVTLLLCFFVLLFSFSTINEAKWREIVESFQLDGKTPTTTTSHLNSVPDISDIIRPEPTPNDQLYNTIKDYIDNHNLSSKVELVRGDRTVTLRFKDTILFDPDSAVLRSDGKVILGNMCKILKSSIDLIEMIDIEGHTAANPKGMPQFKNTFEFSTYRAMNVLKYALNQEKIDPLKLSAVGYGQYHPIGDNETEEGRIRNRRVEIIVTSHTSATITTGSGLTSSQGTSSKNVNSQSTSTGSNK